MTNYEKIKSLSLEEMANELCEMFQNERFNICDVCPATGRCKWGHNGLKDWLQDENRE